MPNYHSIATAARHATRRVSLSKSSSGIHPICGSVSLASQQLSSFDCTIPPRIAGTTRIMGSNSSLIYGSTLNNDTSSTGMKVLAATIAATSSIAIVTNNNNSLTLCESPSNNIEGLADETEEEDNSNSIIQDGMDAGSEIPIKSPKFDNLSTAEEDDDDSEDTTANTADNNSNGTDTANNNNDNNKEEDDEDDPSKDEQTSCSICLINRQGPCRKQWLKFEKCMKEHGAEQDRVEKSRKEKDTSKVSEGLDGSVGGESGNSGVDIDDSIENDGEEKQLVSKEEMEGEWDDFMIKSTKPGDDDDDDDEDDEEEEEDEDEESEDEDTDNSNEEDTDTPSTQQQQEEEDKEDISLSQRCDKYMIPWISCIQEHRNIYSLISNDFYQKDYIDPLEYTVHDSRRLCYNKDHSEIIGEVDGYVIKYHGVEIDLGSWREHVEAESDESNVDDTTTKAAPQTEEPHLINAYAKFQLTNPSNGQPIEVAYIKDQNGRLLGFDSFTKSKEESSGSGASNSSDEEGMPHKSDEEKAAAPPVSNDGECTFHIVPGETTSITAYAIYRGDVVKKEDESNEEGKEKVAGMREDFLFTTPAIPLPGVKNQK